LIAIVALLGLAVDLNSNAKTIAELDLIQNDGDALQKFIGTKLDYLATSRPTAVNLFNAIAELKQVLQDAKTAFASVANNGSVTTIRECLCKAVLVHTEFMLQRDVQDNKSIGKFGAEAILKNKTGKKVTIMTICNTGSLATAGYGTALGVARALQEMDRLESIIALETRPYNQGSRLTAFEIVEEKMPGGILICDSAAGAMMRVSQKGGNLVHCRYCRRLNSFFVLLGRRARLMPWWLELIDVVLMETRPTKLEPIMCPS
jgi:methylthioribose-1-phosphate isomerase